MEVLREEPRAPATAPFIIVSILVLMEVLREERTPVALATLRDRVSILVLMEVLREAPRLPAVFQSKGGFNPCFNGSVERGMPNGPSKRSAMHVSILVLMEVLREVIREARAAAAVLVSILVLMEVLREAMG